MEEKKRHQHQSLKNRDYVQQEKDSRLNMQPIQSKELDANVSHKVKMVNVDEDEET